MAVLKSALARRLTRGRVASLIVRILGARATHHGQQFQTDRWPDEVAAQVHLGLWESQETRFVRQYFVGCGDVVELGSSIGVVGSHVLHGMREGARFIAVEGNPHLAEGLALTLDAHARGREVTVLAPLAIGERDTVRMHTDPIGLQMGVVDAKGTAEVPGATLDRIVRSAGLQRYSLVSDIEGSEAQFILGDDAGLALCDRMVIELHGDVEGLLSALQVRHGFTLLDRRSDVCVLERRDGTA